MFKLLNSLWKQITFPVPSSELQEKISKEKKEKTARKLDQFFGDEYELYTVCISFNPLLVLVEMKFILYI